MTFVSILYGLFLVCILAIYWLIPSQKLRLWILLLASVIFYASVQIYYIPLLFALIFFNFRLGLILGKRSLLRLNSKDWRLTNEQWQGVQDNWSRLRLRFLWLGIFLNVLLLFGFKYIPFVLNSCGALFNLPVVKEQSGWLNQHLIAPLGISFFCFECIAYLIDVYRGAPAAGNFLKFATYKLLFTKLIAGPITRYHSLASQLSTLNFPSTNQIVEGLWLIACGSVKKAIFADRIGILVELSFSNLERAGSGDLWLAIFAYGLQLYLDFSGYIDIALGSALLLGLSLPKNFDFPYFSASIADFWRRWNITLGDWLRNYLYFPLGGSRQGLARTSLNLLIVMLIAGIWHGAAWGFIVWGVYHGVALVIHRWTDALSDSVSTLKKWWQSIPGVIVAWLITQLMVFTSWIFFRLPNLRDSGWVITHLWGHQADVQFGEKVYLEAIGLQRGEIALLLGGIMIVMGLIFALHRGLKLQLNWPIKIMLVPLSIYAVWMLAPKESLPYIYFDF